MLGLLHGILFLWLIASGERSPWLSFYCGLACGGFLTQAWCERKFLGDGLRVGRESPAPDGPLVQPWLFRDLVTWPLVAVLLAPLVVGLASGITFPLAFMAAWTGMAIFLGNPGILLACLVAASAASMSWRARERRLGPARHTGQRALHAAKVAALFALMLVMIPGDPDTSSTRTLDWLLMGPRILGRMWTIAAGAAFFAGWATIGLRDRFARRAARRAKGADAAR